MPDCNFACCIRQLAGFANLGSGVSSGLGEPLKGGRDLGIENVGVSDRGLDVGVAERALHQFEIAGVAQKLARKVVAVIMEPESGDAGRLAGAAPARLGAADSERIALAPHEKITPNPDRLFCWASRNIGVNKNL